MSIVRVGSTQKFSDNWDNIFSDGKAKSSGKKKKKAKRTAKEPKSAKEKGGAIKPVKVTKKKARQPRGKKAAAGQGKRGAKAGLQRELF